jgi:hypothetical protein
MENELASLKEKTTISDEKVAALEKELAVINPDQKTSMASAQLQQLTTEFTAVQMARVKAESVYNALQSGDTDAVLNLRWGQGSRTMLRSSRTARRSSPR